MGEAAPVRPSLIDGLLAVLLAPACAACHAPLHYPTRGAVCDECWESIAVFQGSASFRLTASAKAGASPPERFARRRKAEATSSLSHCAALGLYEGSLRSIIHALKYSNRRSIGRRLAGLMAGRAGTVLEGADAVVPVPLHRCRLRRRGFNQAEELARHLPLPCLRALRRCRRTATQADLSAAERRHNMRGAFALRRGAEVQGLVLVLVDDVCTTGATLEACADVLLKGSASEVRAITAARAISRPR